MEENQVINDKDDQKLALINKLTGMVISEETLKTPEFAKGYEYLTSLTKYLTDVKKTLDESIKEVMKQHFFMTGENSVVADGMRCSYVPETTRETFSSKDLKADNPEIYRKYVKVSAVSDSIRIIHLNKEKEGEKTTDDVIEG